MNKTTQHIIIGALMGAGFNTLAATGPDRPDPAAIQRLDQESLDRSKREQQLQRAAPRNPEISVQGAPQNQLGVSEVKNIPLSRFDIDSSEILTVNELKVVLAAYEGKTVSLKDLYEAINGINKLYDGKGVKTARAILPAQEIRDGVVKVRLIEARLGEFKVSGAMRLSPAFVDQRMTQQPGDLLSVAQLEADLIRFNGLYQTQLRADVIAGAKVGTTDITIAVQEPRPYQFTTFVDNAGRDSVGMERLGAVFRAHNLAGRSDDLQLLATKTRGSESYGISYSTPISRDDLRLDVAFNYGTIKLVDGPFLPLDISGRSHDLSLGLNQPFAVGLNRQWAAYGRFSSRNSVSQFGGLTQQDLDLHVLTLGISGEARYDDHAWSMDSSLSVGTKEFGGDQGFSYMRASASRVDRLSKRYQLVSRGGMQYSFSDVLPAGEQFQAGGLYSVRGFSEGLLSGRHGYFGSVELRAALNSPSPAEAAMSTPTVQVLVFLDHAATMPFRPGVSRTQDDALTSAGVGLIMDFGSRVSARATLAYPLRDNPLEINSSSPRIHAGLSVSWF